MTSIKLQIQQALLAELETKLSTTEQAIAAAKESRDSNTKSSVGDKYETGRAMMQQELDKLEMQLNQTLGLRQELKQINLEKKFERVEQGSLVRTSQGIYFMVFGFGKLKLEEQVYYVISTVSPIGQVLRGKSIDDVISFNGKEIKILEIA